MGQHAYRELGFTVVELMATVLIIGILVAVAVPVFSSSSERAEQKACYTNARTLEGAVGMWAGARQNPDITPMAGIVNASHPLIADGFVIGSPRCPSAPKPANRDNPTLAEGAYTMDEDGRCAGCAFGAPVHGHF